MIRVTHKDSDSSILSDLQIPGLIVFGRKRIVRVWLPQAGTALVKLVKLSNKVIFAAKC